MLLCDSHTMEKGVPLIKPLSKLKEFILFYSDQPIAYFALVVCKPNNVDKYDTKDTREISTAFWLCRVSCALVQVTSNVLTPLQKLFCFYYIVLLTTLTMDMNILIKFSVGNISSVNFNITITTYIKVVRLHGTHPMQELSTYTHNNFQHYNIS